VQALRKSRVVGLPELRAQPALTGMRVLQRGNRLSITPIEAPEWAVITQQLVP
jgi:predicted RNA-binding protein with PUA-like domain